ncbi:hypothetical protein [Methylobacterium sp. WSM2598]|uniref:hypothetical protein n=1 Tax=Methylobacterium sp. WSM2598 TaxID=398261 RepID=UPI0003A62925|nr:hypothetical protein [Methylobacterium sp. WSM2598]
MEPRPRRPLPRPAALPGGRPDEWATSLENCRRFVDEFGAEAARLGWDALTLFSVHPQAGIVRGDCCGVMMPCSYPVFELAGAYLTTHLWTSRKAKPWRCRGVTVWEFGKAA